MGSFGDLGTGMGWSPRMPKGDGLAGSRQSRIEIFTMYIKIYYIFLFFDPRRRPRRVSKLGVVMWIRRALRALDLLPREAPLDQTRAARARSAPREAPPHVVELRGGADLARAARV